MSASFEEAAPAGAGSAAGRRGGAGRGTRTGTAYVILLLAACAGCTLALPRFLTCALGSVEHCALGFLAPCPSTLVFPNADAYHRRLVSPHSCYIFNKLCRVRRGIQDAV